MAVPQGINTSFNIFRGFNASSPSSISGSPIAASGFLKQNVELGRFGDLPNGLYWTTIIDVPVGTDARDAWNSFLNSMTPANADTVLVQDYPIPGWCTPFMVVIVERLARGLGVDRYRLYLDRCQPVLGPCPTSGGGVSVKCCPGVTVPTTLTLEIFGCTGACACWNGNYTLVFNPASIGTGTPNWQASTTNCGSIGILLSCISSPFFNGWIVDGIAEPSGNQIGFLLSGSCDPFSMTGTPSGVSLCPDGSPGNGGCIVTA